MRIVLFIMLLAVSAVLCSCTQYERDGFNPKPFNSPASWETNPYGAYGAHN